ncbi:MAG TPA: menaquinone biosynthesis decarboxylase [Polyangia bacterium]|nr:menaquinone biosynthesis decarboxylase [Polyangia bacterium]
MAYRSLAEFVARLEAAGELLRIGRELDPRLEIAELAAQTVRRGGPALLCEKVRGSRFPLLIGAYAGARRMAWALGCQDLEEHARAIEELVRAQPPSGWMDKLRMLPKLARVAQAAPRLSSGRAPCQEVVMDPPDLGALPVMTCWPRDGGPFLTMPVVITKDPDTGVRNLGMYRMQVYGPRETGMHWQLYKTGRRHYQRAQELSRRVDVAVVLGGDPVLAYAATAPLPDGVDELLLAGFLRKKPVELTRCQTVDLEVPACADFVLEGYVDPAEPMQPEGPFGDHTGYYTPIVPYPVFHLTALTHRRDAIYPSTVVGPPPMEDAWLGKATERLFLPLLRATLPGLCDMNLPIEGVFHNLCIASIQKREPHQARKLCYALWGLGQLATCKCVIVVDKDVNVHDLGEVAWRALTSIDPKRDVFFADGTIDELDHASCGLGFGGKMGIDATRKLPEEGATREWMEVCRADPEVERRVQGLLKELGL